MKPSIARWPTGRCDDLDRFGQEQADRWPTRKCATPRAYPVRGPSAGALFGASRWSAVPSRLDNLILAAEVPDSVRDQSSLRRSPRWTAVRRWADSEITCGAGDLVSIPVHGSLPVRRFAWRKRQRHRPGLGSVMLPDNGFDSRSWLGRAHRRCSQPAVSVAAPPGGITR